MKQRSFLHCFLLSLAVVAFLSQTMIASASHHHNEKTHHSVLNAKLTTAKLTTKEAAQDTMDHSHHTSMNHSMGSNDPLQISSDSHKDCCDQQCDCDFAHCSAVYALGTTCLEFSINSSRQGLIRKNSIITVLIPPFFRPPIPQTI